MKWSHLAHVLCRNLLKSNPTDCRPLSESFVQIQAGKSEISVGEIAGVVITTVDCRTPGAVAVSRSRVCYSANEGQVDDAKDHPVPPPTVITSKAYLPVLVMIISVPISLNFTHRSSFSSRTWMFLLKPDPECWARLRPETHRS